MREPDVDRQSLFVPGTAIGQSAVHCTNTLSVAGKSVVGLHSYASRLSVIANRLAPKVLSDARQEAWEYFEGLQHTYFESYGNMVLDRRAILRPRSCAEGNSWAFFVHVVGGVKLERVAKVATRICSKTDEIGSWLAETQCFCKEAGFRERIAFWSCVLLPAFLYLRREEEVVILARVLIKNVKDNGGDVPGLGLPVAGLGDRSRYVLLTWMWSAWAILESKRKEGSS